MCVANYRNKYIPNRTRSTKGGWEKKVLKIKPLTIHLNPGTHLVESRKQFFILFLFFKKTRKHEKGLEHSMHAGG